MSNYSSQTLPLLYPYSIVRQYAPQPYYYPFNDYSSSPVLPPISYTTMVSPKQYSSSLKYDDSEEGYFSEYYRRPHHHSQHRQYSNQRNASRVHNTSSHSQPKSSTITHENLRRSSNGHPERVNNDAKNNMSENDNREYTVLKRDARRTSNSLYKPLTAEEFLAKTPVEIKQEYRKMPNPPAKDTQTAKEERNVDKSRYRDVLPGEATRVKLLPDGDEKNDFINANYVSGHNNQEKAYIFAQGPLESTVKDFWRMVWQENIAIVVMTTNIREKGILKCFPYWPCESKDVLNAGLYQIENQRSDKFDSFTVTTLILRKRNSSESRTIYHAHYLKWPDHGIPSNTKDALEFLAKVEDYRQAIMTRAPVLLHCSAGIGRTGTFCAIDIGIKRYFEKKTIDMPSTVLKMRNERAGSVQTEDQYVFAYLALKDYIEQTQALEERINDSQKSTETDLIEISQTTKTKDANGFTEVDDNVRKTTRTKKYEKKPIELGQANTFPSINTGRNLHLQEPAPHRGKALSDSSTSAVQYLTPSTTIPQTDPNRQRSLTEYSSSVPTMAANVHHKKARK